MAATFLKANKVLWPLFACVGAGIGGGLFFASHYLRNNSDVVINKKLKDPWNRVQQNQNTKMMSFNPDFWKGRVGIPDPRLSYLQDIDGKSPTKRTDSEKSYLQRARELKVLEEKKKQA